MVELSNERIDQILHKETVNKEEADTILALAPRHVQGRFRILHQRDGLRAVYRVERCAGGCRTVKGVLRVTHLAHAELNTGKDDFHLVRHRIRP